MSCCPRAGDRSVCVRVSECACHRDRRLGVKHIQSVAAHLPHSAAACLCMSLRIAHTVPVAAAPLRPGTSTAHFNPLCSVCAYVIVRTHICACACTRACAPCACRRALLVRCATVARGVLRGLRLEFIGIPVGLCGSGACAPVPGCCRALAAMETTVRVGLELGWSWVGIWNLACLAVSGRGKMTYAADSAARATCAGAAAAGINQRGKFQPRLEMPPPLRLPQACWIQSQPTSAARAALRHGLVGSLWYSSLLARVTA